MESDGDQVHVTANRKSEKKSKRSTRVKPSLWRRINLDFYDSLV